MLQVQFQMREDLEQVKYIMGLVLQKQMEL